MDLPEGKTRRHLVAVCAQGAGLLFHIVGTATPGWTISDEDGGMKAGLWEACNSRTCSRYPEPTSEVATCEGFAIIGVLAGALSFLFAVLPFVGKPGNGKYPFYSVVTAVSALSFIVICNIVWGAGAHGVYPDNYSLGYSFGLSLAGGFLIALGGILPLWHPTCVHPGGARTLYIAALVVVATGLTMHIIGLATPKWTVLELNGATGYYGLWKLCSKPDNCYDYPAKPSELQASQSFAVIGLLFGLLAVAVALLVVVFPCVGKPSKPWLALFSMASAILALVCVLVSVIVWAVKLHGPDGHFGSSFGVSIAGGILIGIGGVLVYIGRPRQTEVKY